MFGRSTLRKKFGDNLKWACRKFYGKDAFVTRSYK